MSSIAGTDRVFWKTAGAAGVRARPEEAAWSLDGLRAIRLFGDAAEGGWLELRLLWSSTPAWATLLLPHLDPILRGEFEWQPKKLGVKRTDRVTGIALKTERGEHAGEPERGRAQQQCQRHRAQQRERQHEIGARGHSLASVRACASASTASTRNHPPQLVHAPSSGTTGRSSSCVRAMGWRAALQRSVSPAAPS